MKILVLFIIISNFAFGHIDLFNITQGEFIVNQNWDKNYSFDITFLQNIQIDEIGIDHFNVGDNDTSIIEILIFENEKQIYSTKEIIKRIYNQTIFLKINKYLKKGNYRIQINNFDNDDFVSLFKPSILPFENITKTLITNNIYTIQNNNLTESKTHPFVHLGGAFQNGIDLSMGNNFIGFNKEISDIEFIFKPLENQKCTNIGLNNFAIDSAIISCKLINNQKGDTLFVKDTAITKFTQEIDFLTNINLDYREEYKIQVEFNNINTLYLNQIYPIPPFDNTEQIKLVQFNSKKKSQTLYTKDTVGFAITLKFEDKKLGFIDYISSSENEFQIKNNILYVKRKQPFDKINVYNILGNNILGKTNILLYDDYEEFNLLNNGIYLIENGTKTYKIFYCND